MIEKKVVAVIVEGPSDENAIGGILKEFFSSEEVQFAVVYGDITSDRNTSTDNVVNKINNLIDTIRKKYGYHWEDFIRIIHITDTDGAFTKDCIVEAEVDIPDSVIKAIAKKQPLRAVFRDSGFANSPSKINVGEIFKMLAPDTRVKVI